MLDLELAICGHGSFRVISREPQRPGTQPCRLHRGPMARSADRPRPAPGFFGPRLMTALRCSGPGKRAGAWWQLQSTQSADVFNAGHSTAVARPK